MIIVVREARDKSSRYVSPVLVPKMILSKMGETKRKEKRQRQTVKQNREEDGEEGVSCEVRQLRFFAPDLKKQTVKSKRRAREE